MADIARGVIIGRIVRDPELNDSGKVLSFSVAVNRRQRDANGEYEDAASFFDIRVLGNRAQGLAGFLAKGRQVAVDARIVQERWEKDGQSRSVVRFIADEVVPLGPKADDGEQGGGQAVPDDDTIPFAASLI
jgi:single-strand DNA-binding protein